jgi:hypothetical protein
MTWYKIEVPELLNYKFFLVLFFDETKVNPSSSLINSEAVQYFNFTSDRVVHEESTTSMWDTALILALVASRGSIYENSAMGFFRDKKMQSQCKKCHA